MPEQSFAVYRHEDKYLLSPAEAVYLRGLLRGVLTPDAHGDYAIRSLYFDRRICATTTKSCWACVTAKSCGCAPIRAAGKTP